MNDVNYLKEVASTFKGYSPSGMYCSFIQIDEKWGIKVYDKEKIRDKCYDTQKNVAEAGFAPLVGVKFQAGNNKFCYITEVADCLIKGKNYDEWCENWNNLDESNDPVLDHIDDLNKDILDTTGWCMGDNHVGNYGYIDGRLVCIDFGHGEYNA